jgi:hypothetical protein
MDFTPEKPALEVDKVRPSRPGDVGTGGEGVVEKADGEVLLPIAASEEEEPAPVHAVIDEELRPPVTEVALPLAVACCLMWKQTVLVCGDDQPVGNTKRKV